jgi:hypothetical protein
LPPKRKEEEHGERETGSYIRFIVALLDSTAIICGVVALLTLGYEVFRLRIFGHVVLSATGPTRALSVFAITLCIRCLIAYPRVLSRALGGDENPLVSFSSERRSELFGHAIIWIAIGFAGSFGLNFFFHKFLYEHVYVFRGMRVATRWAMISYIGLALLAGLGAERLAGAVAGWWPRFGKPAVYGLIALAILFELHAAPLQMIRGEIDPDALTLDLKDRKMSGGIIELPLNNLDHVYMLRAADHLHPIVNGRYSFVPELQKRIQELTSSTRIPDQVLDTFENIPVSYVTVHYAMLSPDERTNVEDFLSRGVASGRLRFIKSFDAGIVDGVSQHNDLYAVTRTEPNAQIPTSK